MRKVLCLLLLFASLTFSVYAEPATLIRLSNGLKVWVATENNFGINFQLVARGGASDIPIEALGSANAAEALMQATVRSQTQALPHSRLYCDIWPYHRTLDGHTSTESLPLILEQLRVAFTEPAFNSAKFESIAQVLSGQQKDPSHVDWKFWTTVSRLCHGENRLSQPSQYLPDFDTAVSILRKLFNRPADFHLVVVGPISAEELRPMLEQTLALIPATGAGIHGYTPLVLTSPKSPTWEHLSLSGVESNRFELCFPFSLSSLTAEQYACAQLAKQVMQGRLQQEIASKELEADLLMNEPDLSHMLVSIAGICEREDPVTVAKSALNALARLLQESPSEEECRAARDKELDNLKTSSGFWTCDRLALFALMGWPLQDYDKWSSYVENADREQIWTMIKKMVWLDRYVCVTLTEEK